jgi:hypothetical protein
LFDGKTCVLVSDKHDETQQETSILTCRRGEGLAINKFFAFANISISVLKIL